MESVLPDSRSLNCVIITKSEEMRSNWMAALCKAKADTQPKTMAHDQGRGHRFAVKTFQETSHCAQCNLLLWGLINQGFECKGCGKRCHQRCLSDYGRTYGIHASQTLPHGHTPEHWVLLDHHVSTVAASLDSRRLCESDGTGPGLVRRATLATTAKLPQQRKPQIRAGGTVRSKQGASADQRERIDMCWSILPARCPAYLPPTGPALWLICIASGAGSQTVSPALGHIWRARDGAICLFEPVHSGPKVHNCLCRSHSLHWIFPVAYIAPCDPVNTNATTSNIHTDTSSSASASASTNTSTRIVAIYNYLNHNERSEGDLEFRQGEQLELVEETSPHWWKAKNASGIIGLVPSSFVQKVVSPHPDKFAQTNRAPCPLPLPPCDLSQAHALYKSGPAPLCHGVVQLHRDRSCVPIPAISERRPLAAGHAPHCKSDRP